MKPRRPHINFPEARPLFWWTYCAVLWLWNEVMCHRCYVLGWPEEHWLERALSWLEVQAGRFLQDPEPVTPEDLFEVLPTARASGQGDA